MEIEDFFSQPTLNYIQSEFVIALSLFRPCIMSTFVFDHEIEFLSSLRNIIPDNREGKWIATLLGLLSHPRSYYI